MGVGVVPAAVVILFLLTPYFPESPRYLRAIGRPEEARSVLVELLRGDKLEAEQAFNAWEKERCVISSWPQTVRAFCTSHRPAALAGIGCALLQMLGGISVITAYSSYLFMRSGMSSLASTRWTLVMGVVKTGTIVVAAFLLMDRWGRRPLLMLSAALCVAASGVVLAARHLALGVPWMVGGFTLFSLGFSMGLGPASYAYIAEVFDNDMRGKGVSAALFTSRIVAATYITILPLAWDRIGIMGIFSWMMVVNLFAGGYVYVFCPETKGLRLEEVQDIFRCGKGGGGSKGEAA